MRICVLQFSDFLILFNIVNKAGNFMEKQSSYVYEFNVYLYNDMTVF